MKHRNPPPKHDLAWHMGVWARRRYAQYRGKIGEKGIRLMLPARLARAYGSHVTMTREGRFLGDSGAEIFILAEVALPTDGYTT